MKLRHILILILVYMKEILNYLVEMYIVIHKLRNKMRKIEKNQAYQSMSRDITLLHKLLEIKMLD